jgi:hypothetical protein
MGEGWHSKLRFGGLVELRFSNAKVPDSNGELTGFVLLVCSALQVNSTLPSSRSPLP